MRESPGGGPAQRLGERIAARLREASSEVGEHHRKEELNIEPDEISNGYLARDNRRP